MVKWRRNGKCRNKSFAAFAGQSLERYTQKFGASQKTVLGIVKGAQRKKRVERNLSVISAKMEVSKQNGTTNGTHEEPPKKRLRSADKVTAGSEIRDPYCDPEKPVKVTFQDVSAAAYKIKGGIQKTPCFVGFMFSILFCLFIYVELEFLRYMASLTFL